MAGGKTYIFTIMYKIFNIILIAATLAFGGGNFGAYPTYSEVDSAITALQTKYPALVKVSSLTYKSFQGRDIFLVKVSNSPSAENSKPQALISGVIHADEPVGSFVCLNDINYLCANYGIDSEATWLVNNRQMYFVPVMNPDRYVWNESIVSPSARKRKTMDTVAGGGAANGGVDPNRNYPFKWGYDNTGSSPTATSSNYRGAAPVSEPETKAMVDFIANHKIRAWTTYHASGDWLIIPYAYAGLMHNYPPDSAVYFTMCREQTKYYHYVLSGNTPDCYNGTWGSNGSTEDWGTADSAKYGKTYKVYSFISEIGADQSNYWDYYDNKAKLQARCDSLLGCDLYLFKCSGFYPVLQQLTVNDAVSAGGNGDGKLNPGETVKLVTKIENKSAVDTTPAVKAYLNTSNADIQMSDSAGSFGDVKFFAVVDNTADPFQFTCGTTAKQGEWIRFRLRVAWTMNGVNFEKNLPCSLQVGNSTGAIAKNSGGAPPMGTIRSTANPGNKFIRFVVTSPAQSPDCGIELEIYDSFGKKIRSFDRSTSSGSWSIDWNLQGSSGRDVKQGVYFVTVRGKGSEMVQKALKIIRTE
jgi:hypothetical protein